ncbi:MAG: isoaspartyl peptidase/L-asparaginase [Phycisphaerales bacterium]
MHTLLVAASLLAALMLAACHTPHAGAPAPTFAIALHGGAGVIDKNAPADTRAAYEASLRSALSIGRDELARGGSALDACEKVVRFLEDDPLFNAGKGAVYTEDGKHELDASIMDGRTLGCGAVAAVRTVKNPVSLARLVMARTRHVMLIGDGAEKFADETGVERVPNSYFDTPHRYEALQKALEERRSEKNKRTDAAAPVPPAHDGSRANRSPQYRGTVGCVALDSQGNLAAATSTGGLTAKRWGRVGDSPVIGAGTYANNATCAVSCTGTGEEFIRHGTARTVSDLMEFKGWPVARAADEVIHKRMTRDDGGLIAVSHSGEIAFPFSTDGMFRGAADSTGRFEVGIWESMQQ